MKNKRIQLKGYVVSREKLTRLKVLSERLHGKFPNFMTQNDLRKMRAGEDEPLRKLNLEIEHIRESHSKHITLNNPVWVETLSLRERVSDEFQSHGHLKLETFDKVLDWKLGRQRTRTEMHRTENTANLIRELTGTFWRVQHSDPNKLLRIKLGILQSISGVGIGVASTILTLSNPAHFAIIDFRNWKVLYSEDKRVFSVSDYKKYLVDVRKLASQLNCDVQEIDFVLWNEFETPSF